MSAAAGIASVAIAVVRDGAVYTATARLDDGEIRSATSVVDPMDAARDALGLLAIVDPAIASRDDVRAMRGEGPAS